MGLARLGAEAAWLGRIGADGFGDRVVRELGEEGVEVIAVVDADAPTGLMVKERPATDTTRPVVYYRTGSAGSRLTPDDLPALGIPDAALLHVTGITPALSSTAHDTVLAAIGIASDGGVPVSFDVNHRAALWRDRDPVPTYQQLAAGCDDRLRGSGRGAAAARIGAGCGRRRRSHRRARADPGGHQARR